MPAVIWVFGLVQRWLGRMALIAIWVFGHVGATLFVMAMEINALYRHIAHFSIVVKPDVGVSYGLAAAVGPAGRPAAAGSSDPVRARLSGVMGAVFAIGPNFTALGHLTAIVIGLGMAAAVHGGRAAATGTGTSVVSESARSLSA